MNLKGHHEVDRDGHRIQRNSRDLQAEGSLNGFVTLPCCWACFGLVEAYFVGLDGCLLRRSEENGRHMCIDVRLDVSATARHCWKRHIAAEGFRCDGSLASPISIYDAKLRRSRAVVCSGLRNSIPATKPRAVIVVVVVCSMFGQRYFGNSSATMGSLNASFDSASKLEEGDTPMAAGDTGNKKAIEGGIPTLTANSTFISSGTVESTISSASTL